MQLEARQIGEEIRVSVVVPLTNPAGAALQLPIRLQVFMMETERDESASAWEGARRGHEYLRRATLVSEEPLEAGALHGVRVSLERSIPAEALQGLRLETVTLVLATRVVDGRKRRSDLSSRVLVSPVVPPDPPLSLSATPVENGILLEWEAPASGEPGAYHLYRRAGEGPWPRRPSLEAEAGDSSVLDESARYGERYTYALRSTPRQGEPYEESVSVMAPPVDYEDVFPPPAPEEVRALESAGGLRVVWFWGPGPPAARYRIEKARRGESFEEASVVPHPSSDWIDAEAVPGTWYRYRVIAEDEAGNRSVPSAEVEGRRLLDRPRE
jgi:hypothetical protein